MPALVRAEREHGSVIRGMIAARRSAPGDRAGSITFRQGLATLSSALAQSLGDRVRPGCPVASIEPCAGGVRLGLEDGSALHCERAVIATPAPAAAALLDGLEGAGHVASLLSRVPLASLAVVGLGYDRTAVRHPLDGFGYLAAQETGAPVLGCMFRSTLFPHVAPAGKALLAVFIGGALHPEAMDHDDAALTRLARRELALRLGAGDPEEVFVRRWTQAVPQYERGHGRIAAAVRAWSTLGPVSVIGNAVTGVSLPDCIAAGRAEADRLLAITAAAGKEAEQCAPA
jgi:oxygen-dependent protoporphyrinogen oxidase